MNNQTIGFTNGCFDLLHYGHVSLLKRASDLVDKLIVGLNSDQSVKKLKGHKRPICSEYERAFILSSLIYVDIVIIFSEETPYELIKIIKPNYLIKGFDPIKNYDGEDIVGVEFSDNIVRIPLIKDFSSTNIINHIKTL